MTELYDVVIIGGGPTGVALGIELGMNHVKTLVLEKYETPLFSPRAQGLNERTMELFMRWKLDKKMRDNVLFPKDYPMQSVWCTNLNGITYTTVSYDDQLAKNISAQKPLFLPLYLTENILRDKLSEFDCVTFLKNIPVESVSLENNQVIIKTPEKTVHAKYAVACDGASSITRRSTDIGFKGLAPKRRMISILFQSEDLEEKITVKKGFLYYLMGYKTLAGTGPVNIKEGIWFAIISYPDNEACIDDVDVSQLLEDAMGIHFSKKILNKHFWDMQIQLADHYSKNNRVFLMGDSAHSFAPMGGLGLNTAFGDVTNLAWKLAAVIQKKSSEKILETYEQERKPVAIRNLNAAEKNAADITAARTQFPPDKEPEKFAKKSARIAKQHLHSAGIALGYCYDLNEPNMDQAKYTPICKPGYFLPNKIINEQSIYEALSPIHWTLIVCSKEKIKLSKNPVKILHVPENTYPSRYILIRPDWHIAFSENTIDEKSILSNMI